LSPDEIENVLSITAKTYDVSVPKLRAVYIRGVKEAVAKGYDGPLHTYGLVRVQRFSTALSQNNHRITQDFDLLPQAKREATPNVSIEYCEDDFKNFELISSVLSGDIAQTIPGAESIYFDSTTKELTVSGSDWSCKIDLKTEEYRVTS
jgi:hypothetical protein